MCDSTVEENFIKWSHFIERYWLVIAVNWKLHLSSNGLYRWFYSTGRNILTKTLVSLHFILANFLSERKKCGSILRKLGNVVHNLFEKKFCWETRIFPSITNLSPLYSFLTGRKTSLAPNVILPSLPSVEYLLF